MTKSIKRQNWGRVSKYAFFLFASVMLFTNAGGNSTPDNSLLINTWERITGRPPTPAELSTMEATASQTGDLLTAVAPAVQTTDFIDVTIRRGLCAPMSVRSLSPTTTLNDFTATCMGIVRDDLPATDFLNGNYTYQLDPNKTAPLFTPPTTLDDFYAGQNHYISSEPFYLQMSISSALKKVNGQMVPNSINQSNLQNAQTPVVNSVAQNSDAAGLITSYSWGNQHFIAGTNRRIVQFAFQEFLCQPISNMRDANVSDAWVGQDVDREPTGNNEVYQDTCKTCHGILDSMRGAFAYWDFLAPMNPGSQGVLGVQSLTPGTVVSKYSRNNNVFPAGHVTTNNSYDNFATGQANAEYFGWGPVLSGQGASQFANMISQSAAFPACMARRAMQAECGRDASYNDMANIVIPAANQFVANKYDLKQLYLNVAANPYCFVE